MTPKKDEIKYRILFWMINIFIIAVLGLVVYKLFKTNFLFILLLILIPVIFIDL